MFVAAHGLGLGARIYGSPAGNINSKKELFQIPSGYKAMIVLRIGNVDKGVDAVSGATPRKKPEEVINYKNSSELEILTLNQTENEKKSLFSKIKAQDIFDIQNGTDAPTASSRRDFLKLSATAALGLGIAQPLAAAVQPSQTSDQVKPAFTQGKDPYALAARFNKFLRVTDVTDGLDAVGRADLTLMDPLIRPLVDGHAFLGTCRYDACHSN